MKPKINIEIPTTILEYIVPGYCFLVDVSFSTKLICFNAAKSNSQTGIFYLLVFFFTIIIKRTECGNIYRHTFNVLTNSRSNKLKDTVQ
jgi:hypothetical protein